MSSRNAPAHKHLLKTESHSFLLLNPLLFLIYINDISGIADYATSRRYAYDTNITFTACGIPELRQCMSIDLQYLQQRLIANSLTLNVLRTEYTLIGSRQRITTGRFPFDQKFRNFRNGDKWYGNFLGKLPENPEIVEIPKSDPFNRKFRKFRHESQMQRKFPGKNFRKFGYTSRGCPLFRKIM